MCVFLRLLLLHRYSDLIVLILDLLYTFRSRDRRKQNSLLFFYFYFLAASLIPSSFIPIIHNVFVVVFFRSLRSCTIVAYTCEVYHICSGCLLVYILSSRWIRQSNKSNKYKNNTKGYVKSLLEFQINRGVLPMPMLSCSGYGTAH